MSVARDFEFDPRLLDLHLGHLSAAEQADLQRQIAADPALTAQDEALTAVFRALDSAAERRAPADLAARSRARVLQAGPPPRVIRRSDALTEAVERGSERVIRLGNLRDIIAVAALIVFAIGIGVPGMLHMRERQQRMGCSANLASLGMGLQQYAGTFNASFPFAGWDRQASWQPTTDPSLTVVPNRRHMYPLLRMAFVADPRLFVCPSQQHVPMPRGEVARHDDFLEARNVSYAYQNMAGVRPSTNDDRRLPLLADENPLFANGVPLFSAQRLPGADPLARNSQAHQGSGQNVLAIGGEVRWATTPYAGIDGDNIWTLSNVTAYTGREGPLTATDSHLLK
jgi:hypothetical protein